MPCESSLRYVVNLTLDILVQPKNEKATATRYGVSRHFGETRHCEAWWLLRTRIVSDVTPPSSHSSRRMRKIFARQIFFPRDVVRMKFDRTMREMADEKAKLV